MKSRIFQMQDSMAKNRSGLRAGPGSCPGSAIIKLGDHHHTHSASRLLTCKVRVAPPTPQTCSSGSHGWWVSWGHLCTSPSSNSWEMCNLLKSFTTGEVLSFDQKNLKIRSFNLHHPRQMEMHSLFQVLLKVYPTLDSSQCQCLNGFLEP